MLSDHEAFDINELAAAAGVTPRTIRYYMQQGLLPSPGTRGPGAKYDRGHLERLLLIKHLQRQHLPLAEIRLRLEGLDDAGVRDALMLEPEPPRSPAQRYIREVLAAPYGSSPGRGAAALRRQLDASSPEPAKGAKRATWERITLTPDVEVHVRRPLSREQNRLVERLLEAARNLFEEEA